MLLSEKGPGAAVSKSLSAMLVIMVRFLFDHSAFVNGKKSFPGLELLLRSHYPRVTCDRADNERFEGCVDKPVPLELNNVSLTFVKIQRAPKRIKATPFFFFF